MARNRCSLCDGKLNADNICTFCGLDNTKSDRYYRLNQSNCDDAGFTHAHEDEHAPKKGRSIVKQSSNMNGNGRVRTVNDCDWEINHKKAQKKFKTDTARQATDYSTRKANPNKGLNGDNFAKKKRMRSIIIIIIVMIIASIAESIPTWIEIIRYAPDMIPYYIERTFDDLFGDASSEQTESEIYEYVDDFDMDDFDFDEFEDFGPDDEYMERFFDEFMGGIEGDSGAEFIEEEPVTIEEGKL